jgi:hypothetical protein
MGSVRRRAWIAGVALLLGAVVLGACTPPATPPSTTTTTTTVPSGLRFTMPTTETLNYMNGGGTLPGTSIDKCPAGTTMVTISATLPATNETFYSGLLPGQLAADGSWAGNMPLFYETSGPTQQVVYHVQCENAAQQDLADYQPVTLTITSP